MKLKICSNGHFYDGDRSADCPYCAAKKRKKEQERYIPEPKNVLPEWQDAMKELPRLREALDHGGKEAEKYRERFQHLRPQVRAYVTYELARQETPQGTSGFHMMASGGVFWSCSWARTKPVGGVSFAIDRACFAGREPLLFYVESRIEGGETLAEADTWPAGWAGEVWKTIDGYSSGIRVEGLRGRVILFRLDAAKIKKLDILYGGSGEKDQPDYVFTWPGAGEFWCTLGEVLEDRLVPLHRDDFCMK